MYAQTKLTATTMLVHTVGSHEPIAQVPGMACRAFVLALNARGGNVTACQCRQAEINPALYYTTADDYLAWIAQGSGVAEMAREALVAASEQRGQDFSDTLPNAEQAGRQLKEAHAEQLVALEAMRTGGMALEACFSALRLVKARKPRKAKLAA